MNPRNRRTLQLITIVSTVLLALLFFIGAFVLYLNNLNGWPFTIAALLSAGCTLIVSHFSGLTLPNLCLLVRALWRLKDAPKQDDARKDAAKKRKDDSDSNTPSAAA
ncbi:MAG TPA: hypothetical protein VEA69_14980 [Tepidisphaeraceae bacterium]|nr:hypothetical protein [Tepidisphaeraceae bacterium]